MGKLCPSFRMVTLKTTMSHTNSFEQAFQQCRIPQPCSQEIILASNSPRRRELLAMIIPRFKLAQTLDIAEEYPPTLSNNLVPEFLSQIKAKAYLPQLKPNQILITADTIVILDNKILGKPSNPSDAVKMLVNLQNNTHCVITGVSLTSLEKQESFSVETEVTLSPLPTALIKKYVEAYNPLDKAGAYGIQEWIGAVAISRINGDFYNVMGLPVNALYNHLSTF